MKAQRPPEAGRHVSPLPRRFAVPAIFVWLLLLKGYALSTRRVAFLYMGMNVAFGVLETTLGQ